MKLSIRASFGGTFAKLRRAGMNRAEIKAKLHQETLYTNNPNERRSQLPLI